VSATTRTKRPVRLGLRSVAIHGHEIGYRTAGSGPVIVLVHGLASSSETWGRVMPGLAEHATVIAPDLIGHGDSAKSLGDYSLGALANGVRDLLIALGHERATLVGHSLGGGVVMQFAFQFPERTERMVLVDSGGLGRELAPYLRALSLPGLEWVLPPAFDHRIGDAGDTVLGLLRRIGVKPTPSFEESWRVYRSLGDGETRRAFFHTLRASVDLAGQRPNALDRLYLMEEIPTLIVWGERDATIPVRHAYAAHAAMPRSRLEVFEAIGHLPMHESPRRFVEVVEDFMATPAAHSTAARTSRTSSP
jgi:pimeloyl-ACP methyl ester carboxylesterase